MSNLARVIDRVFRSESGPVLSTLIRVLGDFQLAEDAMQEAFHAALVAWPQTGMPKSPGGWLVTTAKRKAIDRLRHQRHVVEKSEAVQVLTRLQRADEGRPDLNDETVSDDQLRLMFTCCHPSLALQAQVALTLRTLGGLKTPEIAKAFLVTEATVAQRLVRAKNKIKKAKIPYIVPEPEDLPERIEAVLAVIYLIFNEGYMASSGASLVRRDLTHEAIRLGKLVVGLLPKHAEAKGLLALMMLHDARQPARTGADGTLIALEDQDRRRWDHDKIRAAIQLVEVALKGRPLGAYALQAAIAAVHAEAETAAATDYRQIAILYDVLYRSQATPVVAVNRAVAWSRVEGAEPARLLAALEKEVGDALDEYAPYHLTRADLLSRLERWTDARTAFERAAQVAENDTVRQFVQRKLVALDAEG